MSIEDQVIQVAAEVAASGVTPLHGREAGRYASHVRVKTPQGSRFDGRVGRVVRVQDDTVFVRLQGGMPVTLPFARGELEVL